MILLNPKKHTREYIDEESKEIMLKTIAFFEAKGKGKLKKDDHERVWYSDFLEFQKKRRYSINSLPLRLTVKRVVAGTPGVFVSLMR